MRDPNQTNLRQEDASRFGTVAIVGRTNVGKSTFLNTVLGEPLAIVAPLPQTTRDALLGVVRRGNTQFAFVDTPGLHRPRTELGRRMNSAAWDAARTTDLVLFMTDVHALTASPDRRPGDNDVLAEDRAVIDALPPGVKAVGVVNKIDLLKNKARLLPMLAALDATRRFEALVPASIAGHDGIERILAEIERHLPQGPAGYDEDTLTDRPTSFFAREYIREQVLLTTGREVPHAVAITIDRFDEGPRVVVIHATVHVEKSGQRGILIGKNGSKLKEIGTLARERLERLLGRRVHLELFVRVSPRWKSVPRQLAELGYDAASKPEPGK